MYRHDRCGARRYGRSYRVRVDETVGSDVGEDGGGAGTHNRGGRRHEGERVRTMAAVEGRKELGGVMTSSPGPIPAATIPKISASVPEPSATAWRVSIYSAISRSSVSISSPPTCMPPASTASMRGISSAFSSANWAPRLTYGMRHIRSPQDR